MCRTDGVSANSLARVKNEVDHAVIQPEWDLGKNVDVYEEAKRCEKTHSNGRQPEPLSEDRVFQLERG